MSAATPPAGYPDSRGILELRVAIAERLARTRGLAVDPDEVLLTSGTTDGLRQLLPHLPAGPVGVDDPGYRAAVECVRDRRPRRRRPARRPDRSRSTGLAAAYVTPAHQHPLGYVMPAADRLALLAAAHEHDAFVVEDDYDSEFRYDVAPIPALASLDRTRVAYLGTASKSVGPGLRVGWMVPPPGCSPPSSSTASTPTTCRPGRPSGRCSPCSARAGSTRWSAPRAGYTPTARRGSPRPSRRTASPAGPAAGMYSTWLLPAPAVRRAVAAARDAGFEVAPIADYCRSARLSGLVVGFGGVTDAELDRALAAMVRGLVS